MSRLNKKSYPAIERVPTTEALGRITTAPSFAQLSSPHFHTAAMDGFAVKAESTFGAGPDRPLRLKIGDEAWPVNTGRPIPAETNAVIMIENVNFVDEEVFEIEQGVVPWRHVRRVGEDFVASEMILPSRHVISAYDLGALIAGGIFEIEVAQKPKVLIIPTGSELVPTEALKQGPPEHGLVPEYNSIILSALVEQNGGIPQRHDIVPDGFDILKSAVKKGIESDADLIVINAGSSAGSEDFTAAVIRELGEIIVHGVAMMPGKPTILGVIDGKPIMGNPGYPVSAILSFEIFGLPTIETMLGAPHGSRQTMSATSARKISSKLGQEEFFRVKLGKVGERTVAAPLPRGAGSITTLTKADGIIRIPAKAEGIDQGANVNVELLRKPTEVERTLVCIGSHDLLLDVLADELARFDIFLSSSHVGSLGGLLALKNQNCHFATSHLLDESTGKYNWSYIKRYIPNIPVRVFHGVMRDQGFMTLKGNPKRITSFEDLSRPDVKFINRQAGAGTRVLLDYFLKQRGTDSDKISGYELEEYTHTSVAIAVLSGVADVGMGVLSAAQALGLDFVPLAVEQYDFVIREEFTSDLKIRKLLEVVRSAKFKERVLTLGGYGVDKSGEEIPEY